MVIDTRSSGAGLPSLLPPRLPSLSAAVASTTSELSTSLNASRPIDTNKLSPNDYVTGLCRRCNTEIGLFANSWTRVAGPYYVPIADEKNRVWAVQSGRITPSDEEGVLEGCQVRQLNCQQSNCSESVGIFVCQTPPTASAYVNRHLFKFSKIKFVSNADGKQQMPNVVAGDDDLPTEEASAITEKAERGLDTRRDPPQLTDAASTHSGRNTMVGTQSGGMQQPSSVKEHSRGGDESAPGHNHRRASVPQGSQLQSLPSGLSHRPQTELKSRHQNISQPAQQKWDWTQSEALDRLQAQVSLNRATLEQQMREVQTLNSSIARYDHDLRKLYDFVNVLTAEVRNGPTGNTTVQRGGRMDDEHFDLLSSQVTGMVAKTNEIDSLKLKVAMLERKLKNFSENDIIPQTVNAPRSYTREQLAVHAGHSQQMSPPLVMPKAGPANAATTHQHHHHLPGSRAASYGGSYAADTGGQAGVRLQPAPLAASLQKASGHPPRETLRSQHDAIEQSGARSWATVNAGAKRSAPNHAEESRVEQRTPHGSPKRARLALPEPHGNAVGRTLAPAPAAYESRYQDEHQHRHPRHVSTPVEARRYPDTTSNSTFVTYKANGANVGEDNWRPYHGSHGSGAESPGDLSSPRGRGRGRGTRGRPRKYPLVDDTHYSSTAEYERASHHVQSSNTAVAEDGSYYYQDLTTSNGGHAPVRRASAGHLMGTLMELVPGSQTNILNSDTYSQTKKTRTKPTRNASGVLIRKDGRPDMRSQSSAANLRKVHARKDDDRRYEDGRDNDRQGSVGSVPAGNTSRLSGSWTAANGTDSGSGGQSRTSSMADDSPLARHGDSEDRDEHATANTSMEDPSRRESGSSTRDRGDDRLERGPFKSERRRPSHGHDSASPEKLAVDVGGDSKMDDNSGTTASHEHKTRVGSIIN